jgi:hypothetical protein
VINPSKKEFPLKQRYHSRITITGKIRHRQAVRKPGMKTMGLRGELNAVCSIVMTHLPSLGVDRQWIKVLRRSRQ